MKYDVDESVNRWPVLYEVCIHKPGGKNVVGQYFGEAQAQAECDRLEGLGYECYVDNHLYAPIVFDAPDVDASEVATPGSNARKIEGNVINLDVARLRKAKRSGASWGVLTALLLRERDGAYMQWLHDYGVPPQ